MPRQQLIDAAKALIAIPSTADRPDELETALALVERRVANAPGVTIERFIQNGKPSFLAYYGTKRPARFRVLLNGHVDVVPANADQFKPYEQDGKLYGRGALDMKTAALVLAEVFYTAGPDLPYALGLQIVTDEEIGGADGTAYQIAQGVDADFAIAGEFTPPQAICTESRGICWLEVAFKGVTAHGAYLWNGQNAVLQAQAFVHKLLEQYPIPATDSWVTTVNVAALNTDNQTFNRVPDTATLRLDIRYVAGDPNFKDKKNVLALMQRIDQHAKVKIVNLDPAHFISAKDPDLRKLATALREVTGHEAQFIHKHGAADIRYYSARGTPAVAFGLQGEGLHGDTEFVELASLERYQNILQKFLLSVR